MPKSSDDVAQVRDAPAIDRRSVIAGGAMLPFALAASNTPATAAPTAAAPIAARPDHDLDVYLALRFGGRDRPVWWVNHATVFVMVLGRATQPMFDVIGLGREVLTVGPDGVVRSEFDECGWYCAPGTTAPLASTVSPINGRTIAVKHYHSPNKSVLSNGAFVAEQPFPGGWEVKTARGALQRHGDDLWITDDIFVRRPRKVSAAALLANPAAAVGTQTSLNTYQGKAPDYARARCGVMPATTAYQTLATWRDWFDADETPGVMSWRMHGTKVVSVGEIPSNLRALVAADHATLLQG